MRSTPRQKDKSRHGKATVQRLELNKTYIGDVLKTLRKFPDKSVHMVVTSPPYFQLRKYLDDNDPDKKFEIGLEKTPQQFIRKLVKVFRELRRVLRDDGTVWLNISDTYCNSGQAEPNKNLSKLADKHHPRSNPRNLSNEEKGNNKRPYKLKPKGIAHKSLFLIPERLVIALQEDGWVIRQDIIWYKRSVMPESVTDRFTKAHEYIWLISKKPKYYFDNEAVKEPISEVYANDKRPHGILRQRFYANSKYVKSGMIQGGAAKDEEVFPTELRPELRNKRSVWDITSANLKEDHYAAFPQALVEVCIKAGTSAHGCCASCGAPHKRIVKPSDRYAKVLGESYHDHSENGKGKMQQRGENKQNKMRDARMTCAEIITTGWAKTCKCETNEIVPAVVLDTFMGSGTSGIVANKLGRNYVGIDLQRKYSVIEQKRRHIELGMFNHQNEVINEPPADNQVKMFE